MMQVRERAGRAARQRSSFLFGRQPSGAGGAGDPRNLLTALLQGDGATVADYQPGNYTGTLNASAWLNSIGAAGSLAQAAGAAQPIIVSADYIKKAYLPGVNGNYFSTPDSAAASVTGDIDLRWHGSLDAWKPAIAAELIAKVNDASTQIAYDLYIDINGKLNFRYSADGTNFTSSISSVANAFANGSLNWVRATYAAATGKVNYYTSSDGATWTALGTEQTITAAAIFDSTSTVTILANSVGLYSTASRTYRAQIYNGIAGTLAVDFNAADWSETSINGATQVSSTTGETWTLNNTNALPAQIVGSPSLLADGTAHKMATANFTLDQPVYGWIVAKPITYTTGDWLLSGTAGAGGIIATTGSPKISVNAGSSAAENTGATLNAYHIIEYCINGASSYIAVDGGAQTTGDAGAGNPGGLSLFSDNGGINYGNWQVKEWVTRTSPQTQITPLLKSLHGTP